MSESPRYLLDVNLLLALTSKSHAHHALAISWFTSPPDIEWSVCAFTEAGFIRTSIAPRPERIGVNEAIKILRVLAAHPGYSYVSIDADWETLCGPFFNRLYGHNQVTDAYLLGIAVRNKLILATLDKGIVHLAGSKYKQYVLLLEDKPYQRLS